MRSPEEANFRRTTIRLPRRPAGQVHFPDSRSSLRPKTTYSRREAIKKALGYAAGFALIGSAAGLGIFELLTGEDIKGGRLVGKPIEGAPRELKITDPSINRDQIELRREPGPDAHIVAWTVPTKPVEVEQYYGYQYPGPYGLGYFVGPDKKIYGRWFKPIEGVPAFKKSKEGLLLPLMDKDNQQVFLDDVYIEGNFLRPPTEQEIAIYQARRQ